MWRQSHHQVKQLIETCIVFDGYQPDADADGWIVLIDDGDIDQPPADIWDDWTLLPRFSYSTR